MKKSFYFARFKTFLFIFLQTVLISGITVAAVIPSGCKITESGIEIVGGDFCPPVLKNVNVINEKSVSVEFSKSVQLITSVVSPVLQEIPESENLNYELNVKIAAASGKFGSIEAVAVPSADNKILTFNLKSQTVTGNNYEILGLVKDSTGNSLTFSVPFTGYNSKIPDIIFTEIHTGLSSQNSEEKTKNIRRSEYIRFMALSDGNLAGLELYSGVYGEAKKYVFPAVEVHKGEVFVFHPRSALDGCISEEGEELNLAYAPFCDDSVRDLWGSATSRTIGEKTDILVIKNAVSEKFIDAVMYCEQGITEWSEKLKIDFSADPDILEIYEKSMPSFAVVTNSTSGNKLTPSYSLFRSDFLEICENIRNTETVSTPLKVTQNTWKIEKTKIQ